MEQVTFDDGPAAVAAPRVPPRAFSAALFVALRPQQWVKNLLVLAPLLFSRHLFDPSSLLEGLSAFGLFCLVSSSSYLFNDFVDVEQDRLHPVKCRRPLASGRLGARATIVTAIALCITGIAGGLALGRTIALALCAYVVISAAYSLFLKHHVILDVFAIASGFVLRAWGGAEAIQVEMSSWLLVCTTLLALFLGFSKRRYELALLKERAMEHRRVLADYDPRFLDMMIAIVTASAVTCYALYTVSEETVARFHTKALLSTLPFVLYGIFRYLYLVYHKDRGGDPIVTAFTDPATIINLLLWAGTVAFILYGQ
ncbi:MAG TPA: decaprenyl-phosphate phosphoribosyltransferase [Chthoniobacterales bacterium]